MKRKVIDKFVPEGHIFKFDKDLGDYGAYYKIFDRHKIVFEPIIEFDSVNDMDAKFYVLDKDGNKVEKYDNTCKLKNVRGCINRIRNLIKAIDIGAK